MRDLFGLSNVNATEVGEPLTSPAFIDEARTQLPALLLSEAALDEAPAVLASLYAVVEGNARVALDVYAAGVGVFHIAYLTDLCPVSLLAANPANAAVFAEYVDGFPSMHGAGGITVDVSFSDQPMLFNASVGAGFAPGGLIDYYESLWCPATPISNSSAGVTLPSVWPWFQSFYWCAFIPAPECSPHFFVPWCYCSAASLYYGTVLAYYAAQTRVETAFLDAVARPCNQTQQLDALLALLSNAQVYTDVAVSFYGTPEDVVAPSFASLSYDDSLPQGYSRL